MIKMIIKGRSPTMRHVSRTHSVALDWLHDRINLDPKIQIKYIDTRNQLADIYTKGNFTRDEWNHFLCLLNISHFSYTDYSEVMSKRTQKDAGEERVTAKSKPMMNFGSRCSERNPNLFASTASESLVKTRHESQLLLSSWNEQHHRTGRLVLDAYSSSYSEWNADEAWSSQEWKSDELLEDRTGGLVVFAQHTDRFIVENDKMNSYTETESDLSFGSRSFLHGVNDQVRKGQKRSSMNVTENDEKHSVVWGMLMSSAMQASVFMRKNFSDHWHPTKNTGKLTMKQMFDKFEKLITEQSDEVCGISTGKTLLGSIYLWLVIKKSSVSCTKRFTYSHIL